MGVYGLFSKCQVKIHYLVIAELEEKHVLSMSYVAQDFSK